MYDYTSKLPHSQTLYPLYYFHPLFPPQFASLQSVPRLPTLFDFFTTVHSIGSTGYLCLHRIKGKNSLMHTLHPMQRHTCGRSLATHTTKSPLFRLCRHSKTSTYSRGLRRNLLPAASNTSQHFALHYCADRCTLSSNGHPGTRARCSPQS